MNDPRLNMFGVPHTLNGIEGYLTRNGDFFPKAVAIRSLKEYDERTANGNLPSPRINRPK